MLLFDQIKYLILQVYVYNDKVVQGGIKPSLVKLFSEVVAKSDDQVCDLLFFKSEIISSWSSVPECPGVVAHGRSHDRRASQSFWLSCESAEFAEHAGIIRAASDEISAADVRSLFLYFYVPLFF